MSTPTRNPETETYCSHCTRITPIATAVSKTRDVGFIIPRTITETLCPDCNVDFIHDSFWGGEPICDGECWNFTGEKDDSAYAYNQSIAASAGDPE